MSDAALISLITTAIPALLSIILLVINNRQTITLRQMQLENKEMKKEVGDTKVAVEEVAKHGNSMHHELVKLTGEAEFAKGLKQGQEE